ncbi:MAG: 30S ribosomal protein S5 [Patescibacteria group bacterium]
MPDENTTIKKSRRGAADRRARPKGRRRGQQREQREFEQKILELSRVTRVTKGGKRMRFRTCLIIGDRKGRVGIGVAKGADVAISVEKAFRQAKKNLINVSLVDGTFPHAVRMKYGAASILLKPAPEGTGLKSGGAIRLVLELAGVPNAVSKILGSNNKINNAKATFEALKSMKQVESPKKGIEKKNQQGTPRVKVEERPAE